MNSPKTRTACSTLFSRDVISAGFFLVVGILYYASSLQYDLHINVGGIEKPGPGLLPRGLGVAIILCSLVILITSIVRERKEPGEGFKAVCATLGLRRANLMACLMVILSIAAYLLVVDVAGFLLTSTGLIMFMLWALGERRWWFDVLVGLVSAFSTYGLFWTLMRVPLPAGTLWQ